MLKKKNISEKSEMFFYSRLKLSTGSSFAAFDDGYNPAITLITTLIPNAIAK